MKTPDEIKKGLSCYSNLDEVKRHIQCCIDTENCLLCSFFKEGCDKSTFAKLMREGVQQLEAHVPKWISVKERLPEANVFAIVYVTNPAGWWDIELDCVDKHGNWTINADSDWHTVTHWMPLPEPPKEEKTNED